MAFATLPPRVKRKSGKADAGKRSPAMLSPNPFIRLHADPDTVIDFKAWVGSWGECWLWDGSLNERGYGSFCHSGRRLSAHRSAYMLFKGPICGGLHVLHECDVRNCVNPAHLRLGTHADNMRDMTAKGRRRGPKGESAPSAKLTAAEVIAIRQDGRTARAIAPQYGVSKSLVWAIKRRQIWRHL